MSLDGAFLHIVKNELGVLIGAKLEKIHQPSREEILLTFRGHKLVLSANSEAARLCLTDGVFDNPSAPPMFCVILRKHIGNGRLSAITQDGLERVICLDFDCTNEIGDPVKNRLIIEITGRNSNIILVNETGRIIDGIKRVTDDVSSVRRVLPNVVYEPPPRDYGRYCLLDREICEIPLVLDAKTLLKTLEGVSPVFTREAVFRAGNSTEKLAEFLQYAKNILAENTPEITLISDKDGVPRDFCFVDIRQYGDEMTVTKFDGANALLDVFFREKAARERLKQRSGGLMKTLDNSYERLKRKLAAQKQELLDCAEREKLKICGDLINANIYKLTKGDTFLEAENYVTGESEKIKLDSRLTPAQNAQKFYSAYRKLCNAEKTLTKIIADGERELIYLDSVIDAAKRASSEAELDEIRAEISKAPAGKSKKTKPLEPIKYTASDNTEILAGRNNRQNDELTFKIAAPDDIWLHTKDIPGSHVILRCSGKEISENILTEAAQIAAYCSKARDSGRVPVDYTFRKYVKKPSGAKPGYVIFTNNKTLYVNPRKENL